jgi:PBP1b-binding outer membrane lipoprotein LpoB
MNAKLVLIIKQLALLTLALFIVSCAENGATDKSFQMATRAERAMAVETTALSNVPPVTEKLVINCLFHSL